MKGAVLLFHLVGLLLVCGYTWYYITNVKYPTKPIGPLVSDCSLPTQDVDSFNNNKLFPALEKLCERVFFTYFKVNYWRECEIWPEDQEECTADPDKQGGCGICPCDRDEIPEAWRCEDIETGISDSEKDKLITNLPHKEKGLNKQFWNTTENQQDIEELWTIHDQTEEYINLRLNPERNTGYGGPHAAKIWRAIYMENCFSGKLEDQCLEERAFYRLVSGIHGSTAVQVAERFEIVSQPQKQISTRRLKPDDWEFSPNIGFYAWHVGNWPDRAVNIYFTWSLLHRAFHKARTFLLDYPFNTGNLEDDNITSNLIREVLKEGECPTAGFEETTMFSGSQYKGLLKQEFKQKFLNVSKIMDCVACQNCRIHGKLSMLGIATALKILLDQSPEQVYLPRNEVIALVNTLYKFSESIRVMELMRQRIVHLAIKWMLATGAAWLLTSVTLVYICSLILGRKNKSKPLQQASLNQNKVTTKPKRA